MKTKKNQWLFLLILVVAGGMVLSGCETESEKINDDDPDQGEVLPPDDGPIIGAVSGTIHEEHYDADQSHSTVTLNRLCHTIEKFTELQSQIATTPQGAVVMMIVALRIYQEYPIEGMKCLTATSTSPLIMPSENPGSFGGYIMSNTTTLRQRLASFSYLPYIYYYGATPANGYTPDAPPYTVHLSTNPHSYNMASDGVRIRLLVATEGADSDRPVTVKKVGDIYKVTEYSSLYLGPKPPH